MQSVMRGLEGRGDESGRCDRRQLRANIDMAREAIFDGSTKSVQDGLALFRRNVESSRMFGIGRSSGESVADIADEI